MITTSSSFPPSYQSAFDDSDNDSEDWQSTYEVYRSKGKSRDVSMERFQTSSNTDSSDEVVGDTKTALETHEAAKRREDDMKASRIMQHMYSVADAAPDPELKQRYKETAEKLAKLYSKDKGDLSMGVGKILLIVLAAPFALVVAGILLVISFLYYGIGSMVKAVAFGFAEKGLRLRRKDGSKSQGIRACRIGGAVTRRSTSPSKKTK